MSDAPYQRCERRSSGRLRKVVMMMATGAPLASKTSTGVDLRRNATPKHDAHARARSGVVRRCWNFSCRTMHFLQIIAALQRRDDERHALARCPEPAWELVMTRSLPSHAGRFALALLATLALLIAFSAYADDNATPDV